MLDAPQPAQTQPTAYAPSSIEPLICEGFEGINTTTTRAGVDDKEIYWSDNFMPLGPKRNLRTMYGLSTASYTAAVATIAWFDFGNIGSTPYMFVFNSNGSIVAINTSTLVATTIAPAGTISSPSRQTMGLAQWGSLYIQFVAKQTNGYFIWDGTTFHKPGGSAPGGGTMPTAIGGTAIENYAGRVWIANGATITFSAPGSVKDFSSANGGGNFTSTDSFLRAQFTNLKQTNGFLYLIGDSSVNYISGVQTSGSPPVTTFTNQNADPETGTAWPGTVMVFNRNILFANPFGAQISYGGAVTKISEKLDGVYNTVPNFGSFIPSAAKAIIFGKKVWILLLPIIDPVSNQQVNKLFLWNQKIWWAASQEVPLSFINFQEINSVLTAWATDGTHIYQMFAQPSATLEKIFQTRLWDTPGGYQFLKFINRFWAIVQYYNTTNPEIDIALDSEAGSTTLQAQLTPAATEWLTATQAVSTWLTAGAAVSTWLTGGPNQYSVSIPDAVGTNGVINGFTVSTASADMAVVSMMLQPDIATYRG